MKKILTFITVATLVCVQNSSAWDKTSLSEAYQLYCSSSEAKTNNICIVMAADLLTMPDDSTATSENKTFVVNGKRYNELEFAAEFCGYKNEVTINSRNAEVERALQDLEAARRRRAASRK